MEMAQSGELLATVQQSLQGQAGASTDLSSRLKSLVHSHDVMMFMKGTPEMPRCGFSARVCEALQKEGVTFGTFDILTDEAVRQGLKEYSNWPTYPQVFVKGELLGGCDIVMEMAQNSELGTTVNEMLHVN